MNLEQTIQELCKKLDLLNDPKLLEQVLTNIDTFYVTTRQFYNKEFSDMLTEIYCTTLISTTVQYILDNETEPDYKIGYRK